MLKKFMFVVLLTLPAQAFASPLQSHYAGNNLILMSFLTGFALVALVQFGHTVLQGLRKDKSSRSSWRNRR